MRRNPVKAKLLENLCKKSRSSSPQEWHDIKDQVWADVKSLVRPGLRYDITHTINTFYGTARWYSEHKIDQFVDYANHVTNSVLSKVDLGEIILLDVSRPMDVWAGHQLTQVRHLILASCKYEKIFDMPIWGTRKSEILENSTKRKKQDLFSFYFDKFKNKYNRAFLTLNRVYESSTSNRIDSAGLNDLPLLFYTISDFNRILRAGRLEFYVKEPQSTKTASLCLYGILTGKAHEAIGKTSTSDASFIKVDLEDHSGDHIFFYLTPDDYTDLLTTYGQNTIDNNSIAVLVRCRFSTHVFETPIEIVPIRVWIISEKESIRIQTVGHLRTRIRIPIDTSNKVFSSQALDDDIAHKQNGFFEYIPNSGVLDDVVSSNPFFQNIIKGYEFEQVTRDLRQIAEAIHQPPLTPPRPLELELPMSIELILRAFYPNIVSTEKLVDWSEFLLGDSLAENRLQSDVLVRNAVRKLAQSNFNILVLDDKARISKCTPFKSNDTILSKYMIFLISIYQMLRFDTLLNKTTTTLGLNIDKEKHLEEIIRVMKEREKIFVVKNRIRLSGRPADDIEIEDREDKSERVFLNLMQERRDTYTSKKKIFTLMKRKIPDLELDEIEKMISDHLEENEITCDLEDRYALAISEIEAKTRLKNYMKKHFTPKKTKPSISIIQNKIESYLKKNSPKKFRISFLKEIIRQSFPNASMSDVTTALRNLNSEGLVLVDKSRRYSANPTPPRLKEPKTDEVKPCSPLHLNQKQIISLPSLARAHQSGIVYVKDRRGNRKVHVRNFEESETIMVNLIKDVQNGRIIELKYEDHLKSKVRIWRDKDKLMGTYDGSDFAISRLINHYLQIKKK